MDPKTLEAAALAASIANPTDSVETTLQTDAVSVGITDPLFGSGKRIKWSADQLKKYAPTFKGMPITAEIREDGSLTPHSKVTIGHITDVLFDEGEQKIKTDGILWNHYYGETIEQLKDLYEQKKAEVSWEFDPEALTASPEDGDDVFIPDGGRFVGLAIVGRGADKGNAIRLLASTMEKEDRARKALDIGQPGSFEWIGNKVAEHLTASANTDNFVPKTVLGTFLDHVIYRENDKYFKIPYTIEGTDVKFSDTIEVEPSFQPLGASAAGSSLNPEVTPTTPVKEAEKPVAEIDEKELATLKASAEKVPTLETENADLKAKVAEGEAAKAELDTLKAAQTAKAEEERKSTLAASRLEEVEKIKPYEDASQKKEDLEAFKTMDDSAFEIVKRVLAASVSAGGVANEGGITPPTPTREDPDGAAAAILESDDFKRLTASMSGKEND